MPERARFHHLGDTCVRTYERPSEGALLWTRIAVSGRGARIGATPVSELATCARRTSIDDPIYLETKLDKRRRQGLYWSGLQGKQVREQLRSTRGPKGKAAGWRRVLSERLEEGTGWHAGHLSRLMVLHVGVAAAPALPSPNLNPKNGAAEAAQLGPSVPDGVFSPRSLAIHGCAPGTANGPHGSHDLAVLPCFDGTETSGNLSSTGVVAPPVPAARPLGVPQQRPASSPSFHPSARQIRKAPK